MWQDNILSQLLVEEIIMGGGRKMTLDEAIKYAENMAILSHKGSGNIECERNHRQLAEWLRDYKRLLEQEPCEDCISRREAIKMFTYNYKGERIPDYDCDNWPVQIDMKTVKKILRELPSVNPQPKTGHWIGIDEEPHEDYECDKCGYVVSTYTANIEPHTEYKFCPNCGAKMVEPKESEGEE